MSGGCRSYPSPPDSVKGEWLRFAPSLPGHSISYTLQNALRALVFFPAPCRPSKTAAGEPSAAAAENLHRAAASLRDRRSYFPGVFWSVPSRPVFCLHRSSSEPRGIPRIPHSTSNHNAKLDRLPSHRQKHYVHTKRSNQDCTGLRPRRRSDRTPSERLHPQ